MDEMTYVVTKNIINVLYCQGFIFIPFNIITIHCMYKLTEKKLNTK